MQTAEVELPQWWVQQHLKTLALDRAERYPRHGGAYGHNTGPGNEIGLRGEAAVLLWLDGLGWRLNSYEDKSTPDVMAGRPGPPWVGMEVKTWSHEQWERFGRQISALQIEHVHRKAWLVVWAVAFSPREDGREYVSLRGWSSVSDVLREGRASWTAGVHPNVLVPHEALRPMSELAELNPVSFPIMDFVPAPPDCSHTTKLGFCWGCSEPPEGTPLPAEVEIGAHSFHLVGTRSHDGWEPGTGRREPLPAAVFRRGPCRRCFPLTS